MSKITSRQITKKDIWEKYVLGKDPKSFLQSWNWGETNKLLGKKVYRLGFYKDSRLIGVSQTIKEKALRGPHFVVPGGPIIDWENRKLVNFVLKTIRELAKAEGAWFVRVRPDLLSSDISKKMFGKFGFISAPMHLHAENTWVLDISPNEEVLLAGMRKTTRYLIRKSLGMGLTVEESLEKKDTKILTKLQDETTARHKFVGFSENIFKSQIETFGKDGQARLFICYKDKAPLVAAIIIFYGEFAYYHHSGSTMSFPSIPSSYFLQWKVILRAKELGKKFYNFWGIASTDNPRHRFAGVTIFKKGFGGQAIDWLHAQDLPISKCYWFTYLFETVRRIIRRLD